MLNMLKWPESMHAFLTVLILLCVAAQTVCLIMSHYKRTRGKGLASKLEYLWEFWLLCTLFLFPLMHGDLLMRRQSALFVPLGYDAYRIAIVALLLGAALCIAFFKRRVQPLLLALPALVLLPFIETALGAAYPYCFLLSLFLYFLRAAHLSVLRYQIIRTSLSSLAVKHAIDSLDSGVLFCEQDGHILLINPCMQQLMEALTGSVQRNGIAFYDMLPARSVDAAALHTADGIICRAPDESVWLLSKSAFTLGRKLYTQIAASDITRQWQLTEKLKEQNDLLRLKSEELKKTIANLHLLSRKKETQEIRLRANDILGNRLSFILSGLYSRKAPDSDVLLRAIDTLIEDLKRGRANSSAEEELSRLQKTFLSIGVEIRLEGALPADAALGKTFAEIIGEAVTNAVRHGFATEISVTIRTKQQEDCLEIRDNGQGAPDGVVEGRGIRGMRVRLAAHQGDLEIEAFPRFTISATVPRGGS